MVVTHALPRIPGKTARDANRRSIHTGAATSCQVRNVVDGATLAHLSAIFQSPWMVDMWVVTARFG
jgi:hypothetical protein